jgi:uncharacterized membrane protein YoaK (UPF0700 family)
LLSEDKKYEAKVTAILESSWKSANVVAGVIWRSLTQTQTMHYPKTTSTGVLAAVTVDLVCLLREMTITRCDNGLWEREKTSG